MKIGFLFAGQGAQYVGMGKEFYQNFDEAKVIYDKSKTSFDVKKTCFEGPEETLNDTTYAQACILATSLAIAKVIESKGIIPDYVAGLSLGEYSALAFSNVWDVNDALQIVSKRGAIMANALPKGTTSMAAVLNLDAKVIQEVCDQVDGIVEIANYNCPGQIVISGEIVPLQQASDLLLEKGARRVIPLNVSGAFHSSLLNEASVQLSEVLNKYQSKPQTIPVVFNISGSELQDDINVIMSKQIKSSVYFMQSIQYMIDHGVDTFIEIGPGKSLGGFVRKVNRDVKVYSIEDIKSLEIMLEEIQNGK